MSKEENGNYALLVSKLAIERCQHQVAHLSALIYLSGSNVKGINSLVADSAHDILITMERELACSAKALDHCL